MNMKIYLPGGKKVYADYLGFTHETDQPVKAGGEGTAPAPFNLFLASIGTCAGIYVLGFCRQRGIDTKDIELIQSMEFDPVKMMISKINIEIKLPESFPEKYKNAVIQSANLCAVKKHLENPPRFNVFAS
ncbi:MAG: OsmC family protein [Candidatus Aminicenantes bacterium]|nr:OsmC family protein [Candidatus Aminicenantes bacterium]